MFQSHLFINTRMTYSIHELARLAGVSVRTLHFYDEAGLLSPDRDPKNGYRTYGKEELLLLQQILFFRELDLPLAEIRAILESPQFDVARALREHRQMLRLKRDRLDGLLQTIEETLHTVNKNTPMNDDTLYDAFSSEKLDAYAAEAKARWGNTDAYKQSQARMKKMGKDGLRAVADAQLALARQIGERMTAGSAVDSFETQTLIELHYDGLRHFYEPTLEIYEGLAGMYVGDERFRKYYEDIAPGLAVYMSDAMRVFIVQKAEK